MSESDHKRSSIELTRWEAKKEEELLTIWENEGLYSFKREPTEPIYSIDTPPPYTTNRFHVGAAAHYVQQDMVARYKRLRGFNVLFPFGLDRNGQPVEVIVEREHNVSAKELPRETFLQMCKEYLDSIELAIINQTKRFGMSCAFDSTYRTDSPQYRETTQSTFIDLWHKDLVYESGKPVNYCPRCGTSLADADVWYEELATKLVHLVFLIEGTNERVSVATTRPELIMACAALIYNPDDERHKHLLGRTAIVPMFGKRVKVLEHPTAQMDFGTGLVMICSYGDYSDVRLFRELKLDPTSAIDRAGRMTEAAGKYKGLSVEEARERLIQDLMSAGLVTRVEPMMHRTPTCWRCNHPIEIIESQEYYLKQVELLDEIRGVSRGIRFYPEASKQILDNWIDSITEDWPISRRRFYATEVPVWHCQGCGKPYLPPKGKYYRPWKEAPPEGARCEGCGSTRFFGDERVFDTWMDSSISELFIIGYGWNPALFGDAVPASLRVQGYDIVRTWLYYSILRAYLLTGGPAFREVRISGMGLDEKGQAMHKSKGNVIYPDDIIERYGADAFRFWAASESKLGSNYRYSEEKIKGASLFMTKLWNIARFISTFPLVEGPTKIEPLDAIVLQRFDDIIDAATRGYDELDTFEPANQIKAFIWGTFADHYVEAVKPRAYVSQGFTEPQARSAWYTLHVILRSSLVMLHPIMPFMTDLLLRQLYGKRALDHGWAERTKVSGFDPSLLDTFMQANSSIWAHKKELGISLKNPLDREVYLPNALEPLSSDMAAMHKIRNLKFTQPPASLSTTTRGVVIFSSQ